MSEVRFITRNAQGAIQMNGGFLGMYLLKRSTISVNRYNTEYNVDSRTKFVAYRAVDQNHWLCCNPVSLSGNPNNHSIRLSDSVNYITGSVEVFEFTTFDLVPPSNHKGQVRFNLYDGQGRLTFAGTSFPLQVPYIFGGQVHLNDAGLHVQDGYTVNAAIQSNKEYAVAFSIFAPTLTMRNGGDANLYEITVNTSGGVFKARQKAHKLGKSSAGFGVSLNMIGSEYISHMLVDVTDIRNSMS